MRFEKPPAVVFPLRAATRLPNRPRPCVPTRVLQVGRTGIVSPLGTYSIMDLEDPHAPPPTCEPLSRTTAPPPGPSVTNPACRLAAPFHLGRRNVSAGPLGSGFKPRKTGTAHGLSGVSLLEPPLYSRHDPLSLVNTDVAFLPGL